jgi:oxygen-independent coproporphyrinogen-3 oxidase
MKNISIRAAAHSFDGQNRSWNVASLTRYIEGINNGTLPSEIEHLDILSQYKNCSHPIAHHMGRGYPTVEIEVWRRIIQLLSYECPEYLENQLLKIENGNLKLTRKGIFISDGIMSDLMWVK